MKYYGVANHSLGQVLNWLGKRGVPLQQIQIVDDKVCLKTPRRNKRVLVFIGKGAVARNKQILQAKAYDKRQGIIMDDPITLVSYANVTPLDYKLGEDLLDDFILSGRLAVRAFKYGDTEGEFPRRVIADITKELIAKVKERGSILNPFMSLVYTLSSATHQKPVKVGICHWMFYGGTEQQLEGVISIIDSHAPLNVKVKERIRTILLSDNGHKYMAAFKKSLGLIKKGKTVDYDELAAELSISAYDMRYARSVVSDYSKFGNMEQVIGLEVLRLLRVPKTIQQHREPK